jgi:hypothetical protein
MPTRRVAYCRSSAPHDADRQLVIRVRNELIPSTLFARASQCGSVRAKGRPDCSLRECPAVPPEALARLSRGQPRRRCPAVGHQRRRGDHRLHLRRSRSKGPVSPSGEPVFGGRARRMESSLWMGPLPSAGSSVEIDTPRMAMLHLTSRAIRGRDLWRTDLAA